MARTRTSSRRNQAIKHSVGADTPPRPIPIPGSHREILLPVYCVGSVKFEELCCDVLKHAHPQVVRKNLKRKSGLPQFGVDVEGFNAAHEPEVVISCKCRDGIVPRDLLPWTNDFVQHIDGHWKARGVKVFALAITHPGNSDEIAQAIRDCQAVLTPHGIRFELWDTRHVTDLLRKELALIDRYFSRGWVEAISPTDLFTSDTLTAGRPGVRNSVALIELSREIADLSRDRDGLLAKRIDDASAEYRAGRSAALVACLDEIQGDHARWPALGPPLQAKTLRARAMIALNRDDETAAGDLLAEADGLAAAPDRSSRAWYVRSAEGLDAAIAYLQQPQTPRELEILACLHLETRQPSAVLQLAVAWCHSCGIKVKVGRVRKMFEDAIRAGTGTPSHVVVLAMLEADRAGNSSAAKLIARHRPSFAADDAFLLSWQKRFAGEPGDDAFADAMRLAERKSYGRLIEHIRDAGCSANQVLIGASLLALRRQWPAVNSLRTRLLRITTPRAIDLAARAALENGENEDVVQILDRAASVFPDGELTASLRYLRARANDNIGRKGAAIADLRSVASDDADPAIRRQLIHSLICIGRLNDARDHARSFVALPGARAQDLVQFADVFKLVDAPFSRTLIEKAAADPKLPPRAAPSLMVLASMLGHAEVEDRMMQVITAITKDGSAGGIIRFENVEDVIAFMKKRGDALHQEYDIWHAGMKPAHVTFAGDAKTFTALYLAAPADRVNALNKPLPMLVRAANARSTAVQESDHVSKPKLIVDISALLLAKRCNLIDLVERAFDLVVPVALPLALIDLEDAWPPQPEDFANAARAWLSDTTSAVQLVAAMPDDAQPIGVDDPPFKLIPERLLGAC